ncbi:hypothetical protein E3Q22_01416 [Wallemia mellicola]|uniref:DUF1748-domain-containing protein n=2 Tax=Wallemia mellicola TaxID=1708541 RepID=A0A4T0TLX8_9BASI|nr:DUF1748-domain-containing protein [Wallemia mellicola CBS 633.66]TIB71693.1 hypothetical protein E3Q24_02165 [Wallemia mellicola]EIM21988.1 DUF1748-domain-containing protein [Wallemia mellicola CBS 633.66]TIB79156.1 hypothetical protein E3Q23_00389 [Wallemia mellicola]TIB81084.1 hypothetical protein E3Q22_01416 [Wallemia mellicola]TIB84311.1 hypothetical protein E3Q21_02441 [Wallemia mellicola]|eukprot:XP_006957798.1 DUF1748-domain-containing protein [Wallemia mellicola CBS 633.66]
MFGLGKLTHYAFDAVLISIALAGVKRSTGLTLAINRMANKDARKIIKSWLDLGEYCFDGAVILMQRSKSFIRDV